MIRLALLVSLDRQAVTSIKISAIHVAFHGASESPDRFLWSGIAITSGFWFSQGGMIVIHVCGSFPYLICVHLSLYLNGMIAYIKRYPGVLGNLKWFMFWTKRWFVSRLDEYFLHVTKTCHVENLCGLVRAWFAVCLFF